MLLIIFTNLSASPPSVQNSSAGLQFKVPPGCADSDCMVSVRITVNPDPTLLSFHFAGTARAWVAAGFTKTPNMVG